MDRLQRYAPGKPPLPVRGSREDAHVGDTVGPDLPSARRHDRRALADHKSWGRDLREAALVGFFAAHLIEKANAEFVEVGPFVARFVRHVRQTSSWIEQPCWPQHVNHFPKATYDDRGRGRFGWRQPEESSLHRSYLGGRGYNDGERPVKGEQPAPALRAEERLRPYDHLELGQSFYAGQSRPDSPDALNGYRQWP